jgi:hypothetical protein
MKRDQGSLELLAAEGGGEIELTVKAHKMPLGLLVSALKERIKSYGLKDIGDRDLTLVLTIPAEEDDAEGDAEIRDAVGNDD